MLAPNPQVTEGLETDPSRIAEILASVSRGALCRALEREAEETGAEMGAARRALLAKFLPQLNLKLEDELKGLISLQKSIQEEDKTNAKERAIGRAFNSERRRFERQLVILNLELLKLKPAPEGLTEAEREQHEIYQAETMEKLSCALDNLRTKGKLVEAEPPYPKRTIAPRRNLRREELERRTSLIKELTAFCEVVEGVVAGERIVDDKTMQDLITRARAYLTTEGSETEQPVSESVEYSTTEDWQYTQRLIDKRTPYSETLSTRAETAERERIEDETEDNPKTPEVSKRAEPSSIFVDGGYIPNPKLYPKSQSP